MKPIHSITNVLVGSLAGGALGFAIAYLVQAGLLGEATGPNTSLAHHLDATSRHLTVRNINLAGAIAGAVIGSVAGATVSIVQAITMKRSSQDRHGF